MVTGWRGLDIWEHEREYLLRAHLFSFSNTVSKVACNITGAKRPLNKHQERKTYPGQHFPKVALARKNFSVKSRKFFSPKRKMGCITYVGPPFSEDSPPRPSNLRLISYPTSFEDHPIVKSGYDQHQVFAGVIDSTLTAYQIWPIK